MLSASHTHTQYSLTVVKPSQDEDTQERQPEEQKHHLQLKPTQTN